MLYRISLRLLSALVMALIHVSATAAPDEIQVYTDDMNAPGEFGVETHINYVFDGARTPSYEGESPSHHTLQITPEFSYGISKNFEAGMYVPLARAEDGTLYENGMRLRIKYIATPAADSNLFWGLNVESGYSDLRVSEARWGIELRPIIGYRNELWLASINPIVNTDFTTHQPTFAPAIKLARRVAEGIHAGLEYYCEYNYDKNWQAIPPAAHHLYFALDIQRGKFDINLGVGRGDSNAADSTIVKTIIALPF